MLGDLRRSGFDIVEDHEESDAIIVNTCAFVDDAKSESLDTILEAAEVCAEKSGKRLLVTGCLAQRYSGELADQLPEVDAFLGFERYGELPETLRASLSSLPPPQGKAVSTSGREHVLVGEATVPFRPEWDRFQLTPSHSAYLRVAEGCNHACTFCAIPGFRGKFRSKPQSSVMDEARVLVDRGVKELILIAEDTNQYGMDRCASPRCAASARAAPCLGGSVSCSPINRQTSVYISVRSSGDDAESSACRKADQGLAELMRELSKLEGLHWIRILYAYPSYFSEELIDEIANNPKVVKYIDMPLQHISNLTLLAMNRPPRDYTQALLEKLRARIPDLALRTTFIAGFPGETEEQHRELVDFCRSFKFERMGAFVYSEEEGTPAHDFPSQVCDCRPLECLNCARRSDWL